ncbi:hypothetical protein B0H14DRAFT_3472968 [Mycena olivaceomarginata]|nr:hypothetical protein B0H14DRAFT_3472968 [Mycena olivaceomarginata]
MSSAPVRIHLVSRMTTLHSASAERPDHPSPTFPYTEQRRRDPVPKPRSRRCFVCGTTGRHPLDFRVCPHTTILLRRSLAKLDNNGRLVSIDGSPLPMTRHPGGVLHHSFPRQLLTFHRVPFPTITFQLPGVSPIRVPPMQFLLSNSLHPHPPMTVFCFPRASSTRVPPHAVPPIELIALAPEHVPLVPASFLGVLLACLLHGGFRAQLHTLLDILEDLDSEDHSTFQQCLHPVFSRIPHFIPVT